MNQRVVAAALAWLLSNPVTWADDGAASIAAGGIVMKRESRITMAKEVLRIGVDKITVDYDFRNDTDADITTEVAFPIPSYSLDFVKYSIKEQGFEDFKLLVDGKPVQFNADSSLDEGYGGGAKCLLSRCRLSCLRRNPFPESRQSSEKRGNIA